jgi:hypothetical protein
MNAASTAYSEVRRTVELRRITRKHPGRVGRGWVMSMLRWMVGVCAGLALGACAMEDDSELQDGEEVQELTVEGGDEANLWTLDMTGETAPSDQDAKEGDVPEVNVGCVHIQWCNEPGRWGTVCKVDRSCTLRQIVNECTADGRYVCGRIIQPAVIRW